MDKNKWANTAPNDHENENDYFVDEPAVTEHPTFQTSDIWCAASLLVYGIELLEFRPNSYRGKGEWIFDNTAPEPEAAWKLAREYRIRGAVVLPVLDLRDAYRRAARIAAQAREGTTNEPYQRP